MRLVRTTSSGLERESDTFWPAANNPDRDHWRVRVPFGRFGNGPLHQSDYEVRVKWRDVEALIRKFHEMEHPDAIRLQRSLKLGEAAERFIKRNSAPPST
jgi:hypothetical protein